jgi:hypothetical protein
MMLTLAFSLRLIGCIDLAAFLAAVMPGSWMAAACTWLGLGEFPAQPIAGYLARSVSLMCALHGALLVYLSCDVERYWDLIRFLALAAVVHGAILIGIDLAEGMPRWWQFLEGPLFSGSGVFVLCLQRRATLPRGEHE